jgi:cytochrome c peroxidase
MTTFNPFHLVWPAAASAGAALLLGFAGTVHGADLPATQSTNGPLVVRAREPIRPIPQTMTVNLAKVALGKKLFHDPVLSANRTVACANCHALDKGGADQRVFSLGINNAPGSINAPTVFNSAFNFKQFWDGRADSLEDQVDGPTQNPVEMGANWPELLARLQQVPEYAAAFKEVYPDGVQHKNVKNAIAEFERSLITPNSRFDRFLRGDDQALTEEEKDGYRKFKSYGCITCHQGVNVGGNMFQPLGLLGDYFGDRGNVTKTDLGRFNVTGQEEDKFTFKVPSLRNVALTAPYFHDGSAKTLEEAVTKMVKYQLGRELSPNDHEHIIKFLKSLTGEYNGKPLQ